MRHVILLIIGFIVINTISVASLYFSLRTDISTNSNHIIENVKDIVVHEARLDIKHDKIIKLDQASQRIEANLEAYMKANGFVYIK